MVHLHSTCVWLVLQANTARVSVGAFTANACQDCAAGTYSSVQAAQDNSVCLWHVLQELLAPSWVPPMWEIAPHAQPANTAHKLPRTVQYSAAVGASSGLFSIVQQEHSPSKWVIQTSQCARIAVLVLTIPQQCQ
jgi:hypothetical protein